jgi:predicted Zn-dependent protease
MRTYSKLIAAGLAGIMLSGCGTNILSKNEEIQVGREGATGIVQKYRLSTNRRDVSLVQGIGNRLVAANNLNGWPWTFKVIDDPTVNAVSLPGGPVYVFRGLLDALDRNESELAGVIAHEIAHVEKRHAAKQYSQQVITMGGISVLLGGDTQTLAALANMLLQLEYSRNDEYDADSNGIRYMARANFDPWGLVRFFEKLQRLQNEGRGNAVTNVLRTHPLTRDRIERESGDRPDNRGGEPRPRGSRLDWH